MKSFWITLPQFLRLIRFILYVSLWIINCFYTSMAFMQTHIFSFSHLDPSNDVYSGATIKPHWLCSFDYYGCKNDHCRILFGANNFLPRYLMYLVCFGEKRYRIWCEKCILFFIMKQNVKCNRFPTSKYLIKWESTS